MRICENVPVDRLTRSESPDALGSRLERVCYVPYENAERKDSDSPGALTPGDRNGTKGMSKSMMASMRVELVGKVVII